MPGENGDVSPVDMSFKAQQRRAEAEEKRLNAELDRMNKTVQGKGPGSAAEMDEIERQNAEFTAGAEKRLNAFARLKAAASRLIAGKH